MTVGELIQQLRAFPEDWDACFTKAGSLLVREEGWNAGGRVVYVFDDGRKPRVTTTRKVWGA